MIETFQSMLNRILNCEPHYLQYLQEIAGISVAVELTDLPIQLTFIVHRSFVEVRSGLQDASLQLTGSLPNFIFFAAQKEKRQALLQEGAIHFSGDLMVLAKVEAFLNHFNFRGLSVFPISKMKQFLENQIEYLQEEKAVLASPVLFDHLKDEVLLLQQEIDRLQARLQRLAPLESE